MGERSFARELGSYTRVNSSTQAGIAVRYAKGAYNYTNDTATGR